MHCLATVAKKQAAHNGASTKYDQYGPMCYSVKFYALCFSPVTEQFQLYVAPVA